MFSARHNLYLETLVSRIPIAKNREPIPDTGNAATSPNQKTTSEAVTRILIVEDRKSMSHALRLLFRLRKNWDVCGEAQDANDAVLKAEELRPDLIVMDYKLQRQTDGLQAADGIFRKLPDVPIVMFTLYKTDELEHAAYLIGIRCVVGKEEGALVLLRAIESQLAGPTN